MSVLVLTYHGIEPRPGPLFVAPDLFSRHLETIGRAGATVLTIGEIADLLGAGSPLPDRAVALTFDDGFASVFDEGVPRLLDRGLRATFFCVADRLGGSSDWPSSRPGSPVSNLASAPALANAAAAGFEIGSHGAEHAPLDTADTDTIASEVTGSRRKLEAAVGSPVRSFAYPFGAPPSPEARAAVGASYDAACTTAVGRVSADADPLALPRVDAHYLRRPELLEAAIAGRSNAYLAARRVGAAARRRLRNDYARATHARTGAAR